VKVEVVVGVRVLAVGVVEGVGVWVGVGALSGSLLSEGYCKGK
jgi:hypothetical protein